MERKTKVSAGDGQQDILITREFDLPVDLLFKAHVEPEIFEEWMSHEYGTTKVLKLETKQHGGFEFQTTDAQGQPHFSSSISPQSSTIVLSFSISFCHLPALSK